MHNPYAPPAAKALTQARTQIVGRSCNACSKDIARKLDGVACVACDRAYHRQCLDDPDLCARCGQSMSALQEAAEEAEATAARETARLGRVLVWSAVLPYALFEVALLGLALTSGATGPLVISVVRGVFEVALVWMTLTGSQGARRLLAFFCGAGLLVSLFLLVDAKGPTSFVLGLNAIQAGFAFWVFTFSSASRAYLDPDRRTAEP
jgi:hypothetical protein